MGSALSSLLASFTNWSGNKDLRVLIVGLDAVGKTSILYRLKRGPAVPITTISTIGFNNETFTCNSVTFSAWDIGGGDKIRPLWRHYYDKGDCSGVIFVVDSTDIDRMSEAREEIHRLNREDTLRDVALLVFANKQDLVDKAMPVQEMRERLQLPSLRNSPWHVQGCCALTGDGLDVGLKWLAEQVKAKPGR